LAIFTEDEFALVVVVLILSTSPVLSSLIIGKSQHELWASLWAVCETLQTFPLFYFMVSDKSTEIW